MSAADPGLPNGPSELQLEVTGSCNLSCQMCLVAYRPRLGRSASLSIDTVRTVLDDVRSVRRLTLQGLGEPLLAPDLDAIVAEAVRRGIEVGFNTNGTLLSRQRAEALVAAGISWIHVSIDAATAETYADIRHGGHLDTVIGNLRGLLEARAESDRPTPWVQLNVVAMRANREELEALVHIANDLGVDRLWIQSLSHDFTDVANDSEFIQIRRWTERQQLTAEELRATRTGIAALATRLGVDVRLPGDGATTVRGADEPACDWPWRSAYVNHDGTVQACCMLMGRKRGVMGNLHDQPISEMWHGPTYTELRSQLSTDTPPAMCDGCAAYRHRF